MENNHQSSTNRSPATFHVDPSRLPECFSNEGDGSKRQDFFHGVYEFLDQIFTDDSNLGNKPCMLTDSLALQAVEQSFIDVLVDDQPISHGSNHESSSTANFEPNVPAAQPINSPPLTYFMESHDQTLTQPEFLSTITQPSLLDPNFQSILNSIEPFGNYFYSSPPAWTPDQYYQPITHGSNHESGPSTSSTANFEPTLPAAQPFNSPPLSYFMESDQTLTQPISLSTISQPSLLDLNFQSILNSVDNYFYGAPPPGNCSPSQIIHSPCRDQEEHTIFLSLVDDPPSTHDYQYPHNHNIDYQPISHGSNHESSSTANFEPSVPAAQPIYSPPLSYFLESDQCLTTPESLSTISQPSLLDSNLQSIMNSTASFDNYIYSFPPAWNCSPSQIVHPSQIIHSSCQDQEENIIFLPCHDNMNHPKEDTLRVSGKRNICQEGSSIVPEAGNYNKQVASSLPQELLHVIENFDKMLLCEDMNPQWRCGRRASRLTSDEVKNKLKKSASSGGKKARCKNKVTNETSTSSTVDFRSLLLQCSQAVNNSNYSAANELLKVIRRQSSPKGDYIERLAHYFCNAIEARLAGTGATIYGGLNSTEISAAEMLKSYEAYMKACPFQKMTNIFANKSIGKVALGKKKLHIIDFGILYGLQWPCIIQGLSLFPGGAPSLRITGIDLPQPGFRPAGRVEETGRHLTKFCERFNVPFEYNAIAKKWENIALEDLKIENDEVVVVNSIYRLRNVADESLAIDTNSCETASAPRDMVLKLIKAIHPDLFVLGVSNGTHGGPYFLTRFREAVHHFSTLFDMFEATTKREDEDRFVYEKEVFGRDLMNVIGCEDTSRIERPETYKKWHARNVEAGFRQMELDKDFVQEVKAKVKNCYHKEFDVLEDGNWLLQGWKGRTLYALSSWKPK